MVPVLVVSDSLMYFGPAYDSLVHLRDFDGLLARFENISPGVTVNPGKYEEVIRMLAGFANASIDVKREHVLLVNRNKNEETVAAVRRFEGLPLYCVWVHSDQMFYAFTDELGIHNGSAKVEEAAYFDSEQEAWSIAGMFHTGEVCTLSLGGIELMSDLPDELDGMTAAEYAGAVGARPW